MAADHALLRLAKDAEDVASGLHVFRDNLTRDSAAVTYIIGDLFNISSVLREIDDFQDDPHYKPSFYRIRDDLALLCPSLQATMEQAFQMFGRTADRPYQMVWDDLCYQMDHDESAPFLERLKIYLSFLQAQRHVITGFRPDRLPETRQRLILLATKQNERRAQPDPPAFRDPVDPQRRRRRPPLARVDTPLSPGGFSDDWDMNPRPVQPTFPIPEPFMPRSPTFTSNSSPTLASSQTSYSTDAPYQSQPMHWAQQVFDGSNPGNVFRSPHALNERSACYGKVDLSSLHHLAADGFVRALELPFDREQLWMRLYWRPPDNRARILIMTKDAQRRDLHYCTAITNLKIIRQGSTLQLCRARRDGSYSMWAKLNFVFYERMVLFYSTLVAMKHQDRRNPIPRILLDTFELEAPDHTTHPSSPSLPGAFPSAPAAGELELFGGEIHDGTLRHALRLWQDTTSGVVRLEACALRGPMKDVPLWTAFVTKYLGDPDWAQLESPTVGPGGVGVGGVVSFAALRPPPYVFLAGYEPVQNRRGEWVLQFTTLNDARYFVERWTGLCRQA